MMKAFKIKKKISLLLAVLICLTAVNLGGSLHVHAGEPLPDYTNSLPEDAQNDIVNRLGKTVSIVPEATDDINKNGLVLRTDPPAGTDTDAISNVVLVVGQYQEPTESEPPTETEPSTEPSTEPEPPTITVPNVINMTQQAVQQSLTENGFGCTIAYEDTDNRGLDGLVVRTEPAIGTPGLPVGTMVTAFLGRYVPRKVAVPDVTGKSYDEAKALIDQAGLTATVIETETDTEDLDKDVFRQEPEAGTEVEEGASVVLHVYRYEEPETTESEEEEDETLDVDGYKVYKKLKGVSVPKNFVAANDPSTFSEPVEAFYSTVYGTFLYYAEQNGAGGYYLYDKDRDTMFPYVPLSDAEGNSFIAAVPADKGEIGNDLIGQTEVNLGTLSNPLRVPAWFVRCKDGTDATVLYLLKSNGTSGFYAYENTDGITLIPWDEYQREHAGEDQPESQASVEPVSTEPQEPEKNASNFLKNNLIWVVIISAILLLLIIAIFVVYKMSRRQEAMELQEDLRERAAQQEKNRPYRRQYDSSYSNDNAEELEPFDISFENAFPDELGLNNGRKRAEGRGEHFVDRDGMLNENAFEDLDISLAEADDRYSAYQEPENRNYIEPKDFGTGHARPKKPSLDDPIIPEEIDEPAPSETIYTKKAKSKSPYQELLEDDFEVVDFRKKK